MCLLLAPVRNLKIGDRSGRVVTEKAISPVPLGAHETTVLPPLSEHPIPFVAEFPTSRIGAARTYRYYRLLQGPLCVNFTRSFHDLHGGVPSEHSRVFSGP